MEFLTNLAQQLRGIWERSSVGYRAALVISAVLAMTTVVGVGWWASRPQYMPLASDLSPAEAARVLEKLEAANIPYKKSFSASIIYVPQHQYADATVAVKDVLGDLSPAEDLTASSIWDPDMKKERVIRQKERALAASILRMPAVASADVHIAMPDAEVFQREKKVPKASVVIGVRRGAVFSPSQAATVARLVASSVEGMANESVTVTDLDGRTIYPDGNVGDRGLSRQYDFKQQLEADLVAKAELMLSQMLGPGRAVVQVYADVDFTETERVETRVDKVGAAKKTEDITTKDIKGPVETAQGVAGSTSNLNATNQRSSNAMSTKEETIKTTWENGTTVDTVREYGGIIKRLTVSTVVDIPAPDPSANPPVPGIDEKQIEEIVKNAVGYDATRNDAIVVTRSPLTGTETGVATLVDTLNRWDFYNNLVRNASLGLAAVVALVLGMLLIRKLQPITALRGAGERYEGGRSPVFDDLSAQVKQNPEVVSKIVTAWLNTAPTPPTAAVSVPREETMPRRAAA